MKFKKKYFVFVQPAIRSMGSQSSATGNGPILNKVFSIDMIHEKSEILKVLFSSATDFCVRVFSQNMGAN